MSKPTNANVMNVKTETPTSPLTPISLHSPEFPSIAISKLNVPVVAAPPAGGKAKRQRKRVNTAEKRASHNAVERMRRETLNSRFLDLARLLPSLANLRRPSKSAIVNGSISYIALQRAARLLAARELRALSAVSSELLAEVNMWRGRNGVPSKDCQVWTEGAEEVCAVEGEVFGEFQGGLGEGGDDDEEDGEDADDRRESFDGFSSAQDNGSVEAVNNNGQRIMSNQFVAQTFSVSASNNSVVPRHTSFASTLSDSPTAYTSYGLTSATSTDSMLDQAQFTAFLSEAGYPTSAGSQHSPLGGSHGDLATPPPPTYIMDGAAGVQTYMDSPPAGVAANSFAQSQDQLEDWAAAMNGTGRLNRQQSMNCVPEAGFAFSGYNLPLNANSGRNTNNGGFQNDMMAMNNNNFHAHSSFKSQAQGRPQAHLEGAHQSLLAHQPHMAAAVFPPASSSSPPSGTTRMHSTSPIGSPYPNTNSVQSLTHAQAHAQIMAAASGLDLTPQQLADWKQFAMNNFLNAQAQNQANAQMGISAGVNEMLGGHVPTVGEMREAARAGILGGGSHGWGIGNTSGLVV